MTTEHFKEGRPRMTAEHLPEIARRASSKLRAMAREFNSPYFTDRYGDGPVMEALADDLDAVLSAPAQAPTPSVDALMRLADRYAQESAKASVRDAKLDGEDLAFTLAMGPRSQLYAALAASPSPTRQPSQEDVK